MPLKLHRLSSHVSLLSRLTISLGPDVSASLIQSHVKRLRKKAASMGVTTSKGTPQADTASPAKGNMNKTVRKVKKELHGTDEDDDEDDGASYMSKSSIGTDSDDDSRKATKANTPSKQQKVIGGRVTKQRSSPRKVPRPDYKAILDQFSGDEAREEKRSIAQNVSSNGNDMLMVEEYPTIKAEV